LDAVPRASAATDKEGEEKMSMLRKLNSYPHNLSFDCELWGWIQGKREHNGMIIPLSSVITRYLREAIAKDYPDFLIPTRLEKPKKIKFKAVKLHRKKIVKKRANKVIAKFKNRVAKSKTEKIVKTNPNQEIITNQNWNLEINDKTPLWVRSIAKKLEVAR
jgi:hypothetical protein